MKKLFLLFSLLFSLTIIRAQETPPAIDANFKQINPAQFWWQSLSGQTWLYRGSNNWLRMARYSDLSTFSPNLTFNNGLTRTGNNISLGGDYSSNILVGGANKGSLQLTAGAAFMEYSSTNYYSQVTSSSADVNVGLSSFGNWANINISTDDGIKITDELKSRGVFYNFDYSSNWTNDALYDNYLTNKKYVDSKFSAIDLSNYVTKTGVETLTNKTLTSPDINNGNINNANIVNGSINNTPIGGGVPNTGLFTTLNATSSSTIALKTDIATGQTIGANTTGNAETATTSTSAAGWGTATTGGIIQTDFSNLETTAPYSIFSYNNASGKAGLYSNTAVKSFLATSLQDAKNVNPIIEHSGTVGYGVGIVGTSTLGSPSDLFLVGQSGFSNGLTIRYDGTKMAYNFASGDITVGGGLSIRGDSGAAGVSSQGTYINWNEAISGGTALINQKGGGTGGFVFQESTTSNVRTTLATLTSSGLDVNGDIKATNLLSGTYTPTITGLLNATSLTANQCFYTRVGNNVTISGSFGGTLGDISTNSAVSISLPSGLGSDFTTASDATGNGALTSFEFANVFAQADSGTDLPTIYITPISNATRIVHFTVTYIIR